jgi:hypothetical protein
VKFKLDENLSPSLLAMFAVAGTPWIVEERRIRIRG